MRLLHLEEALRLNDSDSNRQRKKKQCSREVHMPGENLNHVPVGSVNAKDLIG